MEQFLDAVALVAPVAALGSMLAFACERLVEKFVKPPLQRMGYSWITPYGALVLGLLFAVALNVDLITPIVEALGLQPLVSWAGLALSGLIIGGGSNFVHDLWPAQDAG